MDKKNAIQGNRAVNYLHNLASLLGKSTKRLTVIDRAMADAGMRRKGSGRATPHPTYEESVALLLAATTAAAPLAWKHARKEPTVKQAPSEAAAWLELPCLPPVGPSGVKFSQPTLGATLVALIRDFPWEDDRLAGALSIELNLTAQTASIDFNIHRDSSGQTYTDLTDHIGFANLRGSSDSIYSETIVRLRGTLLAHMAQGRL